MVIQNRGEIMKRELKSGREVVEGSHVVSELDGG